MNRPATVNKYYKFLQVLCAGGIKDNRITSKDLSDIIAEMRLNNNVASALQKVNILTLVDKKDQVLPAGRHREYKINLAKPQPIHAKQLLEYVNTRYYSHRVPKAKEVSKQETPKKVTTPKVVRAPNLSQKVQNVKKFSFLWGLIKFTKTYN